MAEISYTFTSKEDFDEANHTLILTFICVSGLHGRIPAAMDVEWRRGPSEFGVVVSNDTNAAIDFNKIYVALLEREFGRYGFAIENSKSETAMHVQAYARLAGKILGKQRKPKK